MRRSPDNGDAIGRRVDLLMGLLIAGIIVVMSVAIYVH
jgi:hypothetical protein